MIERRRAGEIGIIGEDDQADQVVGPTRDEFRQRAFRRVEAGDRGSPRAVGKSAAFMLEL